jgi:hypothetical protein
MQTRFGYSPGIDLLAGEFRWSLAFFCAPLANEGSELAVALSLDMQKLRMGGASVLLGSVSAGFGRVSHCLLTRGKFPLRRTPSVCPHPL